jgi:hypothetical protein
MGVKRTNVYAAGKTPGICPGYAGYASRTTEQAGA